MLCSGDIIICEGCGRKRS